MQKVAEFRQGDHFTVRYALDATALGILHQAPAKKFRCILFWDTKIPVYMILGRFAPLNYCWSLFGGAL